MNERARLSWREEDRRLAVAVTTGTLVTILVFALVTFGARGLAWFPRSFPTPPSFWAPAPPLWIVMLLRFGNVAWFVLIGTIGYSTRGFRFSIAVLGVALTGLAVLDLRSGLGIWPDKVVVRGSAPWISDKHIRVSQIAGLTTGCFSDRLEFTIKWWSASEEPASFDLAGLHLKPDQTSRWLAAVYPIYTRIPRQSLAARDFDPLRRACIDEFSASLTHGEKTELRYILGFNDADIARWGLDTPLKPQ